MPLRSIPWHRRLETRVATGISLLVALALGAVLLVTQRAATTRALDESAADLAAARTAFYNLTDDRAAFAAAQAALVTALPVFRSHMTDARLATDVEALEVLGEEYRALMKADFCIIGDRTGGWTATPGWPNGAANPPQALRESIIGATEGSARRSIVEIGGRLFLVVTEPARFGDEVLGTFSAGFVLDDGIARRLAEETHGDVNLVAGGRLTASSLGGAEREALARLVEAGDKRFQPGSEPTVERVGNGQYAVGAYPLLAGDQPTALGPLILFRDWRPTADFISQSRRLILSVGLLAFTAALGAGWLFSRRVSRPIQELVLAAGDISGGNWSRQAAARGGDETVMLAQAFNHMTESLRHWYDEAKRRDDQLRQAQKMEAVGRLAGGVAHDFNNLLTAIKGYGEMLLDDLARDDPRRDDAVEIVKAADRASELTRQLLTFSRREAIAMKTLTLADIVRGTEQMLRRLIGEDITLSSGLPAGIWPIRGDTGQIEQVLVNLVVNARDAMPEGGRLRIELANVTFGGESSSLHRSLPPGRYAQLSVIDTGCGMDQDTVTRIFEPFFTTKEIGRGTGLGLSTVYGIVEQNGGAIDVDTAVGKGTTFRVYLPAIAESASPDPVSEPGPAAPGSGSETILLVEDEVEVGALVSRALRRAGYEVLVAGRGDQALEILRSRRDRVDLLLTDVIMPGMSGRELAECVTAERPGTHVLFMSGYSNDAILRHGIETASAHFIQKPFSVGDLSRKIREALASPRPIAG